MACVCAYRVEQTGTSPVPWAALADGYGHHHDDPAPNRRRPQPPYATSSAETVLRPTTTTPTRFGLAGWSPRSPPDSVNNNGWPPRAVRHGGGGTATTDARGGDSAAGKWRLSVAAQLIADTLSRLLLSAIAVAGRATSVVLPLLVAAAMHCRLLDWTTATSYISSNKCHGDDDDDDNNALITA
jgi:hypothetical protein